MKIINLLVVFSIFIINKSYAIPLQEVSNAKIRFSDMSESEYNFLGTIGLNNCSGSVVKLIGSSKTDNVIMLTNGHCIGMGSYNGRFPAMGEVFQNVEIKRSVFLLDKYSETVAEVSTTSLLYATMTDTDMALYELDITYEILQNKFQIEPLILSDKSPEPGDQVEVVSGFHHVGFSCEIDRIIPQLKEVDWIWKNSFRYKIEGCDTYGGTSGSPVIDTQTREVVAIHNTGNDDGELCTMMNPCEIYPTGEIVASKGSSYGQNTSNLYTCLDNELKVDLDLNGCLLPKN